MRTLLIYTLFAFITLPGLPQYPGSLLPGDVCRADFSAIPDNLNSMVIRFTDRSTGPRTAWFWSFGDGATSTTQHPVHTYAAGGHYWVCLTIYDSVSLCDDELCVQITVHEPGVCIADFDYAFNPANSLEVRFEDRSTGNVSSWHWFFGDGTSSDERNPVHVYPSTGKYQVCLTAYRPGTPCNDTRCDTIEVNSGPGCNAMFTFRLDSLNPIPDTFLFHDLSTGGANDFLWRFDDGATYNTRDVSHHFQTPGPHNVCLIIKKLKHGEVLCADSICQITPLITYRDLGGHLYTGSFPINNPVSTGDTGIAILYRRDGPLFLPFDTTIVTTLGYYAFPRLLGGDYAIAVRLTPGSAGFNRYAPGYYPSSLHWKNAGSVTLTGANLYQEDIHMVPAAAYQAGIGLVKGQVSFIDSKDDSRPADGACVLLFDGQMAPVRYTFTDTDGRFFIADLPFGAYQAYVEYPGSYSRMTAVWLDSTVTQITDLDLGLFDHDVTAVNEHRRSNIAIGEPFPNPSKGTVSLLVRLPDPGRLDLSLTTLSGVTVWSGSYAFAAGETLVRLPQKMSGPGIWLLTVKADDGKPVAVKKLLTY